jgi:hypothetical protein
VIRAVVFAYLALGVLMVLCNLASEVARAYQAHRLRQDGLARYAATVLLGVMLWPLVFALYKRYEKDIERDVRRSVIDGPRWQRLWNEPARMPPSWKCPVCSTENVCENVKKGDVLECGICRHHWIG